MLQRYTRPQDFSSVKLNNSKRKKNERERFGDWVGDYKRAHTHTYMYTYTRIYIYVIFKQTLQCTGSQRQCSVADPKEGCPGPFGQNAQLAPPFIKL